jgi:hypothetical protein
MDIELKGLDELKDAVSRLGLFAKTMQMAADKIDEALSAHIMAMDNHVSRLEALHGLQNSGANSNPTT